MRMTDRRLRALLILALALPVLAAPSAAIAQSAGDEQYVDPFQNEPSQSGGGNGNAGGGGQGGAGGGEPAAPAPAPTPTAPTEVPEGTVQGTVTQTGEAGPTLPRTGLALGGPALAGLLLLIGGLTLRRRT